MLTELQTKKLTKLFSAFDVDGNGVRELEDTRLVVSNLARLRGWEDGTLEYMECEDKYLQIHDKMEEFADTNRDGKISLEEHLAFYDHIIATGEYRNHLNGFVGFIFDVFDADGDGTISSTEYREFFEAYNQDEEEAEEAFGHLDWNGDGQLSRQELLDAVEEFYISDDPGAPGNWLMGRLD